jgi:hypothetical protein
VNQESAVSEDDGPSTLSSEVTFRASAHEVSSRIIRCLLERGFTPEILAAHLKCEWSFILATKDGRQMLSLEAIESLAHVAGIPLPLFMLQNIDAAQWPTEFRPVFEATLKVLDLAQSSGCN